MVGVAGFEPTASSSRTKRATRLRHTPMIDSKEPPFSGRKAGGLFGDFPGGRKRNVVGTPPVPPLPGTAAAAESSGAFGPAGRGGGKGSTCRFL